MSGSTTKNGLIEPFFVVFILFFLLFIQYSRY